VNWIDKLIAQKVPAYYLGFVTLIVIGFMIFITQGN